MTTRIKSSPTRIGPRRRTPADVESVGTGFIDHLQQHDIFLFGLILLVISIVFCAPFLSGAGTYYRNDSSTFFEPFCNYIGKALVSGRLPLWNSLSYCGMPQTAISSVSAFYPLNWLFAILPFSPAMAVIQIIHIIAAGVGGYALIKNARWGTAAAITAGFTWALCGYQFATSGSNYTLLASVVWLPLCLDSLLKIQLPIKGPDMVKAALFFALMILGGRPDTFVPAGIILVAAIGFQAAKNILDKRARRECTIKCVLQIAALALGVALSMPVLLSCAEWAALSPRAGGLRPEQVLSWSGNWYDFVCLILSEPLGDMGTPFCAYLKLVQESDSCINFITSSFVGPVAITLAIWGLCDRTWSRTAKFSVLTLLLTAAFCVLGSNCPLIAVLVTKFQFLRIFRYPIKLMIFVDAALAVLAARGIKAAIDQPMDGRALKVTAMAWTGIAFALISLFPGGGLCFLWRTGNAVNLISQASWLILSSLIFAAVLVLYITIGRVCLAEGRLKKISYIVQVCVCLLFTLLQAAFACQRHVAPSDFYAKPQATKAIVEQHRSHHGMTEEQLHRLFLADIDMWSPSAKYLKSSGNSKYAFWKYQRDLLKPNTQLDCNIAETFGFEASATASYQNLVYSAIRKDAAERAAANKPASTIATASVDAPLHKLCLLTATDLIATKANDTDDNGNVLHPYLRLSARNFELVSSDNELNVNIYRVKNRISRAFFPKTWSVTQSLEGMNETALCCTDKDASPLEHTVLLDRTPASDRVKPGSADSAATVIISPTERDEEVVLFASCKIDRPLILSDTYYPGWIATIDGKPTPLFRANAFARAVMVPAGIHTIRFQYEPNSMKLGLWIAACAVLLCTILAFALTNRQRG